jgi:hypothetical protein
LAASHDDGIDLGDRFSRWCALDADGEMVAEDRVSTTAPAMAKLFSLLGRKRIAIETGTHSPWVSRLLESLGHEVIVAKTKAGTDLEEPSEGRS